MHIGSPETAVSCAKFGINNFVDTAVLFNENIEDPVATISMRNIPYNTLEDIIESNKYLLLPRLSSQVIQSRQPNNPALKFNFDFFVGCIKEFSKARSHPRCCTCFKGFVPP